MIDKVKKFFTHKRCKKLLKNNKGFSLLEVLVAVTIIGIISGIAIPRFIDYRENAGVVAMDTTGSNIIKAYNLCQATTGNCTTLTDLNITCVDCADPETDTTNGFCVALSKKINASTTFKACVQIKPDGTVVRQYGGDFKFCYGTSPNGADCTASNADDSTEYAKSACAGKLIKCTKTSDCTGKTHGTGANLWTANNCKARASGGECSNSAVCD